MLRRGRGRRAAAGPQRSTARGARGRRGRLRRAGGPLPRPQLVGRGVGTAGVLHVAVRVPARRRPQRRFLDNPDGGLTRSNPVIIGKRAVRLTVPCTYAASSRV